MTLPEVLFWQAVRRNGAALKFRRQHVFGPYILDFYCLELKFAVELDGAWHEFKVEHDARRDAYLASHGVRVFRVPARSVLENLDGLLEIIVAEARKSSPGRRP
jgi:very-short-patch-repair endonuclease